jgi:hypothetical protein
VAEVVRSVAARAACEWWEVPIWGRVHGVTEPHDVLDLGAFTSTKRSAVACFASQLRPIGPGPADGPVLHPEELAAMVDDTELVIRR